MPGYIGLPFVIAIQLFVGSAAYAISSDSWVPTPSGLRPQNMVHHVMPGAIVTELGNSLEIRDIDGHTEFIRKHPLTRNAVHESGWLTYAGWTNDSGSPIKTFQTTWVVPPAPTTDDGQLIYLFDGLQPGFGEGSILQPVLQWGASPAGGASSWAVASWYVSPEGEMTHSDLIPVTSGQSLVGVMTLVNSGSTFSYTSEFEGINGTSLSIENVAELKWATETLEVYHTNQCSDYPSGDVAFSSIGIATLSGSLTPLNWTSYTVASDCGEHTNIVSNSPSAGEVDIYATNTH
jgi:hypothetical protein